MDYTYIKLILKKLLGVESFKLFSLFDESFWDNFECRALNTHESYVQEKSASFPLNFNLFSWIALLGGTNLLRFERFLEYF